MTPTSAATLALRVAIRKSLHEIHARVARPQVIQNVYKRTGGRRIDDRKDGNRINSGHVIDGMYIPTLHGTVSGFTPSSCLLLLTHNRARLAQCISSIHGKC